MTQTEPGDDSEHSERTEVHEAAKAPREHDGRHTEIAAQAHRRPGDAMSDTGRVMLAAGAICATIAGATCYEGQRISDLREDLNRQVKVLREGVEKQVTSLRDDMPAQIAKELAASMFDPTTALGDLSDRVDNLERGVRDLEQGVQDARRELGSAVRPTLDTFARATSPSNTRIVGDSWTAPGPISVDDAFSVDVRGWVSPVSQDGERLPEDDCSIDPGGVLTVRRINHEERMALVEYTIDDGETDGTSCYAGTYAFYRLSQR